METKHTEGPWKAEGPDMFGDYNILREDGLEMLAIGAVVSNMRPAAEVRANALAFAAAPSLIEALQPFVDLRHQRGSWGVISKDLDGLAPVTVTVTKAQMIVALAAIAKALPTTPKGES